MPDTPRKAPPLLRDSVQWLIAGTAFLLVAAGYYGYLLALRADIARQSAEASAIMAAEAKRAPFMTLEYLDAEERKNVLAIELQALSEPLPLKAIYQMKRPTPPPGKASKAHEMTMELRGRAEVAEAAAAEAQFKDMELNIEAIRAIGAWRVQFQMEKLAAYGLGKSR